MQRICLADSEALYVWDFWKESETWWWATDVKGMLDFFGNCFYRLWMLIWKGQTCLIMLFMKVNETSDYMALCKQTACGVSVPNK